MDIDIFKKFIFRRLKIISENSMDSVVSDVISELECKDGKEDFDQLEIVIVEEDEELQFQQFFLQQLCEFKVESEVIIEVSKLFIFESEVDTEIEFKDSNGIKLEEIIVEEILF